MRFLALTTLFALVCGCTLDRRESDYAADPDLRSGFRDVLDHVVVPAAPEDWSCLPFADQGAWFGFGLPDFDDTTSCGGFTGPFLHDGGRWIGPSLLKLELPGARLVDAFGRPGLLVLESRARDVAVVQRLWFHDRETALIRAVVRNVGADVADVEPSWSGRVFSEDAVVRPDPAGVVVEAYGRSLRVALLGDAERAVVDGEGYRLACRAGLSLEPGDSLVLDAVVATWDLAETDVVATLSPEAVEASLDRNSERWNRWLDAVGCGAIEDPALEILAVKAVQTLACNWRGPHGRFAHDGIFPSSNVWYFNGFWAWDSWKHAAGTALFDPELAASQLRQMFEHQDERGMIADVVFLDPAEDNLRDTKPPLAGWALERVYEAGGDLELVRDLYPRMAAYHEFWAADRDHDRDGLCEYGSTDGTLTAARWESGMDNAVRFDEAVMLRNGPGAWSMDRASVDLNSYLYREKRSLARLASALGDTAASELWNSEADVLGELIRDVMFDEGSGWFYDVRLGSGEFVTVQGPEGWIPLWAGVATAEQAARVRAAMLDTTRFMTHVPFPTVSRDHPEFSDGYWRGLVWLDQAAFAVEGLRGYGYEEDADALTRRLFANMDGATVPGEPLRENYRPLTGEGRNVNHFSWTAAHVLMLLQDLPEGSEP